MNILAFDTCFGACSAAVARGLGTDSTVIADSFELHETGHAERLVPMIGEVLAKAGLSVAQLDRIAVTIGPGTFTGTRIGIAAARALALTRPGVAVVGVSSLAVMAATADKELAAVSGRDLAVAVDARRGEVYVQLFARPGLAAKSQPLLLAIEEAAQVGGSGPLDVAGSGAASVAAAARGLGRKGVTGALPDLQPHAAALLAMAPELMPAAAPLKPLYLRAADAKPPTSQSLKRA